MCKHIFFAVFTEIYQPLRDIILKSGSDQGKRAKAEQQSVNHQTYRFFPAFFPDQQDSENCRISLDRRCKGKCDKRPFPQHFIFTLVMLDKAHHSDDCKIDHISTLIGKQCDPRKCQCQCHQPLCYRFSFFHLEQLDKHDQDHQ